jgi:hypothetical protein
MQQVRFLRRTLCSLLVGGMLVVVPAAAGAQTLPRSEQDLASGVTTVSVAVIGDGGPLSSRGGFSPAAAEAAMELAFRRAGLRVVPHTGRGDSGALLMVMVACVEHSPTCSLVAILSRFSYFGSERMRIPGKIWDSGPVVLTDSAWSSAAQRIRDWSAEQAMVTANMILAARSPERD